MNVKLTDGEKIRVNDSDDIYGIMQRILLRENKIDQGKEHFWIVCLNAAQVILNIELISLGGSDATIVNPRDIFSIAVQKSASMIIAVHNHPSERITPSLDDEKLTDRLIQGGELLGIKLADHLIITPTNYYSFLNTGLMDKLLKSIRYTPRYKLEEKLQQASILNDEAVTYGWNKYSVIRNSLNSGVTPEQLANLLKMPLEEITEIIAEIKKGNL